MPELKDKRAYLKLVNVEDCIKEEISKRHSQKQYRSIQNEPKPMKKKEIQGVENRKRNGPKWMRVERREKYAELKKTLKEVWTNEMESDKEEKESHLAHVSVPSHFKRYTIQEKKIIIE